MLYFCFLKQCHIVCCIFRLNIKINIRRNVKTDTQRCGQRMISSKLSLNVMRSTTRVLSTSCLKKPEEPKQNTTLVIAFIFEHHCHLLKYLEARSIHSQHRDKHVGFILDSMHRSSRVSEREPQIYLSIACQRLLD